MGRDLWVCRAQLLLQQGTHSRGPQATSRQLLEISKEETPQSQGSLSQRSAMCTTDVQREPPMFQFVPTAFFLALGTALLSPFVYLCTAMGPS